jgi:hypothetical protein
MSGNSPAIPLLSRVSFLHDLQKKLVVHVAETIDYLKKAQNYAILRLPRKLDMSQNRQAKAVQLAWRKEIKMK